MVEVPERVVPPGIGLPPEREQVGPRDALLCGLDAETGRMYRHGVGLIRRRRPLQYPARVRCRGFGSRTPAEAGAASRLTLLARSPHRAQSGGHAGCVED